MSEGKERYLFVSHTAADGAIYLEFVFPVTQKCFVDCHFANFATPGAKMYEENILKSLALCATFLVIVSERSVHSKWVKFEVDWAIEHRNPNRIIPVITDDANPSRLNGRLATIPVVDLRESRETAFQALLQRLPTPDKACASFWEIMREQRQKSNQSQF